MGADSGISFNAAVRRLDCDPLWNQPPKDIIPPMRTSVMPPATPSSPTSHRSRDNLWLPDKDITLRYVSNYFRDVHCLYWLYSSEYFHTRLEKTYVEPTSPINVSWSCCLCCILSLGSLDSTALIDHQTSMKSSDYLALAKDMVSEICDEADLDSVRALILLVSHAPLGCCIC